MTPFEAFQTFMAVKMHFTNAKYDYFRYNGKVNTSQNSFETRRDKYQFYKLSKHKDPLHFLVANYVDGNMKWVGDLFTDSAEQVYTDWQKRQQSLTYIFSQDLQKLCTNFNDNFKVVNGQHPQLLKLFRQREVSIETMVILNNMVKYFPYWNKAIEDRVMWPDLYHKLMKYSPFVSFDPFKCRKTIKDLYINTESL